MGAGGSEVQGQAQQQSKFKTSLSQHMHVHTHTLQSININVKIFQSFHYYFVVVYGYGCLFGMLVYLCTTCVSATREGQKRELKLELPMIVSHHGGCSDLNLGPLEE